MSDEEGFDLSYLNEISTMAAPKTNKPSSSSSSKKVASKAGPDRAAIKAVMDKKKDGEKQKAEEYKKNRENLLALRSKDSKSYKRMNAMITRTKGYSKSVIEDAKDISTACGEQQCDEDDYGYESQMSQDIFSKLSTQYSQMPEDERLKIKKKKVCDIGDIKSRVMTSLKKQEEEENGPRKRKRKHDTDEGDDFINDGDPYNKSSRKEHNGEVSRHRERRPEHKLPLDINYTNHKTKDNEAFKYEKTKEKEKEKKKKKPQRPQPPSLNFADLLKVAQTKQETKGTAKVEEIIKEKVKEKEEAIKKKNERPLTAKEKEMQEDERLRKLRRAGKLPNLPLDQLKDFVKKKEGKKCDNNNTEKTEKKESKVCDSKSNEKKKPIERNEKKVEAPPPPKVRDRSKYFALPVTNSTSSSKPKADNSASKKIDPPKKNSDSKASKLPPVKPKEKPEVKARQFPPADVKRFNPKKMIEKQRSKYSSRIESDSEYDSEMDDFIDDGDDGLDEVSAAIQGIFGYNKNKYKDEDDDIDDMEVGFGQVEKEEKKSAKLGALEDLEDMKKEEEERKAKLKKKKLLEKRKK